MADELKQSQSLSVTLKQMFAVQDSSVAQIQNQMKEIHGPGWDARFDFVKILITISGGIFAAILAFSETIFTGASKAVVFLIMIALALLIGSIGCSLVVVWQRVSIASFHAGYFNQRDKIRDESNNVDLTKTDAYELLMEIFRKAVDQAIVPVGDSDKRAQNFSVASGATFILALVLFLTATVARYAI